MEGVPWGGDGPRWNTVLWEEEKEKLWKFQDELTELKEMLTRVKSPQVFTSYLLHICSMLCCLGQRRTSQTWTILMTLFWWVFVPCRLIARRQCFFETLSSSSGLKRRWVYTAPKHRRTASPSSSLPWKPQISSTITTLIFQTPAVVNS